MVPIEPYTFIATSGVLLAVGIYGLMVKRNMIKMVMALEIMFSSAILSLVNFAYFRMYGFVDPILHVTAIIAISVEACLIGIALAFVINAYRHYKTLDIRELRRLRW
jgi:multicomponent Na+:H+ antiporter subunit C